MTSTPVCTIVYPTGPAIKPDVLSDEPLLERLARASGFCQRTARKLSPLLFLRTVLQGTSKQACSFGKLAFIAGLHSESTLAKQSLWERMREPAFKFLGAVLAELLGAPERQLALPGIRRVLVGDSSTLPMDPKLKEDFPGSRNQQGSKAGARLQLVLDVLGGQMVQAGLCAFTRNDQAAARDVLGVLAPGDLLLRDLGYFALEAMHEIQLKGAFFLSRLKYGVQLFEAHGAPLELLQRLRADAAMGLPSTDMEVLVGEACRLPVRLIALRLPQAQADERRRRAREDRDKRLHHKADYYELLGWTLLISNLPLPVADAIQLGKVYALRWRIENLFHAWKSSLQPTKLSTHRGNPWHLRVLLIAQLVLLAGAAQRGLLSATWSSPHATGAALKTRPLSMIKLFTLLSLAGCLALETAPRPSPEVLQRNINYHARYDQRARINLHQTIAAELS